MFNVSILVEKTQLLHYQKNFDYRFSFDGGLKFYCFIQYQTWKFLTYYKCFKYVYVINNLGQWCSRKEQIATQFVLFVLGLRRIWLGKICTLQNWSAHCRSSHSKVFYNYGVINFSKFIGKHLCQSPFFNKVAGLMPAKKKL